MSTNLNFRSALNGFNREDVVHYIEFLTNRHVPHHEAAGR